MKPVMSDKPKYVGSDDRLMITYKVYHQGKLLEESGALGAEVYQMGEGHWPIQIELAMLGEAVGACLHINLSAVEKVFGEANPERIIQMDSTDFESEPEPGELIVFKLQNGEEIEGQVASNTFKPRASASFRTFFDTPCALNITVEPRGTSFSSSTNIAPFFISEVTTNLL